LVGLLGIDDDVIHVSLDSLSDELAKAFKYTSLVYCSRVFQTEQHSNIAEQSEWCDERSRELVELFHRDLMVPRVRIKEAEDFAPRGRVDYLIYTR
jgi:hypothetical protein